MSRCFPFPPPGYEKKPRSDHVDLLAKEKHKEKKHKKEKRDKENREGKDKKDKYRSKDKHKEKKDRKEKHKDRKKDKDKSRSSEDRRTKEQTEGHHEDRFGECGQKAEEIKNFKFTEELGRRIKDEEKGMANRMAEDFSSSRSIEKSNNVTVVEKKRVTDNETVSNPIGTMQRRKDGTGCPGDNFPSPLQRKIDGAGIAMQKERSTSNEMVPNSFSSGQRGNTGMGRPAENTLHSIQRRPEDRCIATASEKERGSSNKITSKPIVTVQRAHDGIGRPAESLSGSSGSIQRKIDGVGLATAIEKEGGKVNESIPNHIITEQSGDDGIGKSVAKAAAKNIERKEKTKERGLDDGKGEKQKDQDRNEKKSKGKGKDRHREKEKEEKIREKGEHKHKEHHKPRDTGKKNQIDSPNIKPLAPQKDNGNSAGTDENTKKRKDFEMNGFLHENDVRPNKFSRAAPSSHSPVENGRTQELSLVATPCSSIEPVVINNTMAERVLEKIKDKKINSNTEATTPSADARHPVAKGNGGKAKASLKPPHPDAKYLNQIYSVPKMEEWPESDDQEWLFSSDHLRPKPKMKLEADETPQVWAHTLQIESVDAIALPYVIPF